MNKIAVVTGAGSGVGRAVVLVLARAGWSVALFGRRKSALQETIKLAGKHSKNLVVCPVDIGDSVAVEKIAQGLLKRFKTIALLVNAAGTNAPKRNLRELALADYQEIVNTNLNGAYYCVRAFLPAMRSQKSGTIINIVSDAGKQANAKAGPAYVMSKFGMAGLTQSINAEERGEGIRACAIFPGDINTPLLEKRPAPPPASARELMLQPEDVAACVLLAAQLPGRAIVEEILIRPR